MIGDCCALSNWFDPHSGKVVMLMNIKYGNVWLFWWFLERPDLGWPTSAGWWPGWCQWWRWSGLMSGTAGVASRWVQYFTFVGVFYVPFCLKLIEYFRKNECTSPSVFQVGGGERLLGKITTTSTSSLSPEKAMHTNVRLIHRIAFLGISLILFARWHVGLTWGCLGWGKSSCCTSQCERGGRSFYCTSNYGWMFENHKIISKMLITLAPIKNSLESASLTTCFLQGAFEYLAMIGLCGALVTSAQV